MPLTSAAVEMSSGSTGHRYSCVTLPAASAASSCAITSSPPALPLLKAALLLLLLRAELLELLLMLPFTEGSEGGRGGSGTGGGGGGGLLRPERVGQELMVCIIVSCTALLSTFGGRLILSVIVRLG